MSEEQGKGHAEFRAGFVAIAGKPNVGKSTLMNALVGARISAVSRRPQTTRDQIKGILTRPDCQIVFVDMPGLIQPRDRFNECLLAQALEAVKHTDVLYHMIGVDDPQRPGEEAARVLGNVACPKFLVINKIDLLGSSRDRAARQGRAAPNHGLPDEVIASDYDEVLRVSALTGRGLIELLGRTISRLPVHPPYYEGDELTDRDARFLAAEIVREKLFEMMGQEVPYSIATQTDEFKERLGQKHFVRVLIFVERDSQKKLVVGAGGRILKKVGALARADIEALLGHPIFLELWVKVRKNWRKNEAELRRLGYALPRSKKN